MRLGRELADALEALTPHLSQLGPAEGAKWQRAWEALAAWRAWAGEVTP